MYPASIDHRLLSLVALITLSLACADAERGPANTLIILDADEDLSDAPDADQDLPADMPAPDMLAPDMPQDMPAPDMAARVNPCDAGLTDAQRLEAWRAERISPEVYDRATLGAASSTITTPKHTIYFQKDDVRVLQNTDNAILLKCGLFIQRGSCSITCDGPMATVHQADLTADLPDVAGQDCYFSGIGVEPPYLSFSVSHQVNASWVWTFDLDNIRLLQSVRSVGPVLIKYFEHYGQCIRLWHTGDGDAPAFKLYDIRQGLWLPRMSADISEEDFFEEAASRVAVD